MAQREGEQWPPGHGAGRLRRRGSRPPSPLVVREGRVVAYRQLDVADEIDLAACQALLQASAPRRGALTREGAQSLVISAPPLEIAIGPRSLTLPRTGKKLDAEVSVRVFDYGAVSFSFEIPIAPGSELRRHRLVVRRTLRLARARSGRARDGAAAPGPPARLRTGGARLERSRDLRGRLRASIRRGPVGERRPRVAGRWRASSSASPRHGACRRRSAKTS